jgi:cytochrome c553
VNDFPQAGSGGPASFRRNIFMKMFVRFCGLALFGSLLPLTFAQDLPAGKGRETLKKVCTQCHDIEGVPQLRYSRADWASLVYSMKDMGADATKAELEEIIDYLAKNFGKEEAKK